MNPKDIDNLIKKLNLQTSAELDSKINDQIDALAESQKPKPATQPNIWRMIMKSKITKLTAAAVIIIAVLIGIKQFSGSIDGTSVAWGALAEKIESVESVVFHLTANVKMHDLPQGQIPKTTAIGYYSLEHGSRVENYIDDKLSFTMYLNPKENIFVSVIPEQKKFMKVTDKSPDELKQISEKDDPRVMVRHMMSTEYEQLGRDKINGIDVEGIGCTGPGVIGGMFEDATARLWVEIGTYFPVRIEIDGIVAGGQMEMSMVMDDFQWNVELDPALFVPDIPSDYTSMEMKLPEVDEGTAINGLRLFAELSDGQYPSSLAFTTLMKEISEALVEKYGIQFTEKEDGYASTITNILPAASFYAQLVGTGKDAVYHGDRVTAENPELVLLRWKVSDDQYRVIFGDLSAEDVTAEELAELEKSMIDDGSKIPDVTEETAPEGTDKSTATDHYNRGDAHYFNGEYDQAFSELTKAIEKDPALARAYVTRGMAYNDKNELNLAIAEFTKVIEIKPTDPHAYCYRGMAYGNKGEYDLAVADYSKAIEIDPMVADAYSGRADAYYYKGEYDKAWKDVYQAQALGHQVDSKLLEKLPKATGTVK